MILATCEILPAKDVNGQDIVPGTEFTSGTIACVYLCGYVAKLTRNSGILSHLIV